MSTPGLSRRGLFALGLGELAERLPAPEPSPPSVRRPTLAETERRWREAAPDGRCHPLWAPVQARLAIRAGREATVSAFGIQSVPDGRAALRALFAATPPGSAVAFATWSVGAVPDLLREAAAIDPLPPEVPGAWAWGSRERLRQDLDHVADDVEIRRAHIDVRWPDAGEALDELGAAVPAVGAALAQAGARGRARLGGLLETHLTVEADLVGLTVGYLAVAARRRAP